MDNTDIFEYNYSAERAREVETIRRKYVWQLWTGSSNRQNKTSS